MREPWDKFFIQIAREVATRATCDRKHVGCLLVKENHILATGYNGSIPGMDHCDDEGHIMIEGSCVRTTHAEQNALAQAAKYGTSINGATAYITCEPCWVCFKLLLTCGVKRMVYVEPYNSEDASLKEQKTNILHRMGIKYEQFKEE